MRKNATSAAIAATFGPDFIATGHTYLQTLRATIGADRVAQYEAILSACANIGALFLCAAPPRGVGDPADHGRIVQAFTDGRMRKFADAFKGYSTILKRRGGRSIPVWEDAQADAFGVVLEIAEAHALAPKTYTAAQLKEREAKKAERKAEREREAKAEEAKAKELHAEELRAMFAAGQAAARPLTAADVARLIRAGAFGAEVALIREALADAPAPAADAAPAPAADAGPDVVDVEAREVNEAPAATAAPLALPAPAQAPAKARRSRKARASA